MKELTAGMFARSLAGHDAGRLYVVVRVEGQYVYLADGKLKTVDKPKKKKRKHIQANYVISPVLSEAQEDNRLFTDEEIRKAIKSKEER